MITDFYFHLHVFLFGGVIVNKSLLFMLRNAAVARCYNKNMNNNNNNNNFNNKNTRVDPLQIGPSYNKN